ncbi:Protein kinase domain [Macleaya cordata]|uniref:non-specific serine/threonine protein kinase n=1 Tax=Macleaya cordata TaxID=56857 RepID=A0A200QB84_MACCD|nr:Protein kinase domain [Macleaya cordata]
MAIHFLSLFPLLLLLLPNILFLPTSAIDFVFNGFDSSDLILFANTTLESNILSLTNASAFKVGRALYKSKIQTKTPNSSHVLPFYSSFIFSIAPYKDELPGHGFVFIFTPSASIEGASSSQHLGLFNGTNNGNSNNHVFGIEFDVFENPEFNDINNNHVGVDVNSLASITAHPAGFWPENGDFNEVKLNDGVNYQVWVDYVNSQLNVSMARAGMKRPERNLISVNLDLADVLFDEMFVGFCAATGRLVQSHRILAWSFSNSNSSVSEALITSNLPSFVPPKDSVFRSTGFIVGIILSGIFVISCGTGIYVFLDRRKKWLKRKREEMEDWELEYWPHRITYQEIHSATKGFSDATVIGFGGNGKVYKGVMVGGVEVAVKRISHETEQGIREFLAEVSSLGRLQHRSLVGMRGWCKRDKGSLILVYDYMENGSLDKRIFECEESVMLSWEERVRVLKDVAAGILYLHEGWESRVLHRDVKASNVLLDKDMNGRLGDFGLARMHGHGQAANTTRVVGTVGYMAPEVIRSGRASAQTDVFGFGILILEVVCGRRPIEDGKVPLVDWVWRLMEKGELLSAFDVRLKAKGGFDDDEVERVIHLGLLCAYPDPLVRPTMRQVVKLLEGTYIAYESEGEGMEVCLLDKTKSTAMWSKYRRSSRHGGHPTFDQVKESLSSSMSLSGSDIISEGR